MAAEVVEDDEAWLYGDENKEEASKATTAEAKSKTENGVKREDREAGELSGEEEAQDKDEDSDSDDDNVQVTIGDIKTWNVGDATTPRNLFKPGGYQKSAAAITTPKVPAKGVDLEAAGTINGASTYEFDIDSLKNEDKPWRKPGADITDYFNYGFTEETWQLYCEKQRRMRLENNVPLTNTLTKPPQMSNLTPVPTRPEKETVSAISTTLTELRRAAPPPNRKMAGTIDVIGGTAKDSRRPSIEGGEPIPVAGTPQYRKFQPAPVVPHMGVPPPMTHLPPPNYNIPPPGMLPPPGLPPTNIPPPPGVNLPPPNFTPVAPFDNYFHEAPPHSQPDRDTGPSYEDRPNFSYDSTRTNFTATYSESHHNQPPHWESSYDDRWSDFRPRSPSRPETDYARGGDNYWRDRGDRQRDRDRERERDSYRDRSRDYDRSRDKERDMDRSRDRDGSREHGPRDDKHRSSRRKHRDEEDLDHHRSKHKKSKKKRDKDDESGDAAMVGDEKGD